MPDERGSDPGADLEVPGRAKGRERALKTKERQVAQPRALAEPVARRPTGTRRKLDQTAGQASPTSRPCATSPSSTGLRADRDHLRRPQHPRPRTPRSPTAVRADRGFDVDAIDWEDYLQRVHFPAITTLTRAFSRRSDGPAAAPKPADDCRRARMCVAVFDLEGTVVDSNLVQQYLWVRSAGVPQGGLAGRGRRAPRIVSAATCAPSVATAASSSAPSCAATRACRSRASRRSCSAPATATPCYRHTSPAAVARDQGAPRRRSPHGAGHRLDRDCWPRRSPACSTRSSAGDMHDKDGVLTGYLAEPPLVDEARAAWLVQLRRARRIRPVRVVRLRRQSRRSGVARAASDTRTRSIRTSDLAREAAKRRWQIDTLVSRRNAQPSVIG